MYLTIVERNLKGPKELGSILCSKFWRPNVVVIAIWLIHSM